MEDGIPCGFQLPHPVLTTGHNGSRARRHQASTSHSTNHYAGPNLHHCNQRMHQSQCHTSTKPLPLLSKSLKLLPLSTTSILTLLVIVLTLINAASAQGTCTNSAGCYPPIENLALGRTILVNSTCTPNELFCPLFLSTDCAPCSAANSASSLNDNDNSTFWVSEIGPNVRKVGLQIDFEAPVFFQGMTMVWQAVRPVAMTLERSCDNGETWFVYRYYAVDCALAFMMEDTFVATGVGPFSGTTPICTSSQSELFSFDFSDALMTFSTSEHTPLNEQETACYETITNIRVVMLDLFPEVRISNTSFQYYGVREWIVRGSCMCNGHAGICVPRAGEELMGGVNRVYTDCMCEHNTASPNCGECLAGFNNAPYLPGTREEANVCEGCMCNGHAADCLYSTALSASTCLNCTDNTMGDQCDECSRGLYQDPGLLLNDPDICIDCDCFSAGTAGEEGVCDGQGQCSCKSNVVSLRCDQCQDGYFNLSATNPTGCQLCDCDPSGSQLNEQGLPRCDGATGQCICRDTVDGDQCNLCRPGSYDLSAGCRSCACNLGGSTSQVCDQSSPDGQCPCKPNIMSTLCTTPSPGYYFLTLDAFIFEAEEIVTFLPETELVLPVDGRFGAFTGRGFVSLPADVSMAFLFSPPRDLQYEVILRFSSVTTGTYPISFTLTTLSPVSPSLNCTSTPPMLDTLAYSSNIPPALSTPGYLTIDSVCLARSVVYQLSLSYSSMDTSSTSTPLLIDSLVLLPDVAVTSTFYMTSDLSFRLLIESCLPRSAASDVVNRFECEEISFTLMTEFLGDEPLLACDCDPDGTLDGNSSVCAGFGGGCGPCQPGVTGQQCDMCINGFFGFSSTGCEACDCDPIGSLTPTCSNTGQCSCKPGVGGPTCGDCLPDYFNFTTEGCTPCDCSQFSSSVSCNVTTGQCPCPEGVTGLTCNECLAEFFNLSSAGCRSCDCDVSGSVNSMCDPITGQCPCMGNLGGRQCSECDEGFFNTGGVNRETCMRCVCSARSNDCSRSSTEAPLQAVQFNFSQLCSSDPVGCEDGWSVLAGDSNAGETFFGPNDVNGLGYILSINMMPMVFVPPAFLGDRLCSYGFNFTAQVAVVSTAALNTNNIIVRLRSSQANASLIGYPHLEISSDGLENAVFITLTISLVEMNWSHEGSSGATSPNLLEFLTFLTDITEISFTADYTVDFIEFVYIRGVSLYYLLPPSSSPPLNASSSISLPATSPVEQCLCPAPYQGFSCESCAQGFARPSGNIGDPCTRCECNGQTVDCDTATAVCLACGGNTTGNQCQRCDDGFYGDPTRGLPCLPCLCPLEMKSFSPTCFLDPTDGQPTCDSCAVGYTGRNCEICMDGFFGNPLIDIGRCTTCECNGNVDPTLGPVCNMTTGECMNCLNNTTGFECELCVLGYFGDPGTDIPCQVCPCDSRGLDQYCDPLFGTCFCLPNVEGERCDSCSPGFFNITAGIGCSECSCNPVRSVNENCDQESGNCSCLANVGSAQDNRCQLCTPGFFNFVPGIGCEACGCSELSLSSECDAVAGRCQCQEGAIGLKCDECAFGFTGRVPNCEPCHDCYFQWFYIIGNFTLQVEGLQSDIEQLITTYYNGHSEESLADEIERLRVQLDLVNQTLGSITLEEGDVAELETILMEMNSTLLLFINRISEIEGDLDEVERTLDQLEQYDGTVNMTSVQDLEAHLRDLNTTVATLSAAANQSLAQLLRDQDTIYRAWSEIVMLNSAAEALLVNFTEGESRIEPIMSLLGVVNTTHMILRRNLTNLDVRANRLALQLTRSTQRGENLTVDIRSTNSSLILLTDEVERRRAEVEVLFSLIQTLNESVMSLGIVADDAEMRANDLMVVAQRTLNLANSTLQNITDTLNSTVSLSEDLADALRIAEVVQSISLPPLEDATMLADRIVSSIVPDELVADILRDVQASRAAAEQALQLAGNASAAVNSALVLVMRLEEDLRCTNTTQMEVEELQSAVAALIAQAQTDIDQVAALFLQLEEVCERTLSVYNATLELILETSTLGVVNREEADQLLSRARQQAAQALQYRDDVRSAQDDLDVLTATAEEAAANASAVLAEARNLSSKAQVLENEATSIPLEDINNLLDDYQQEVRSTVDLQQRIDSLTEEMEQLIEIFTATQLRLQQCYRTP